MNKLLKQVATIASKKEPLFYEDPTKTTFEEENLKYRIVLPIPPSLFEIYKAKTKDRDELDKQLFLPVRVGDTPTIDKVNRLWCFKTLKKIGYEVIQNTYLPEKAHFGVIRACEWMEIILPTIEDKAA